MVSCYAPECDHTSETHSCQMRRFPRPFKSPDRRRIWKKSVRRKNASPGPGARLCSCHFETKNANVPTKFKWNARKRLTFASPEKTRTRIKKSATVTTDSSIHIDTHFDVNLSDCQVSELTNIDEGNREAEEIEEEAEEFEEEAGEIEEEAEGSKVAKLLKYIAQLEFEKSAAVKKFEDCERERHALKSDNLVKSSEIYFLQQKLNEKSQNCKFSVGDIADHIPHYTGLPNLEIFNLLFSMFEEAEMVYYLGWTVKCMSRKDQFLLTLMKLKRNFSNIDLAQRFSVSVATVSNIFLTWLHALHEFLYEGVCTKIPSRFKNRASLPKAFSSYASCRVVLDCTEVFAAIPKKMSDQNAMYSEYKHRITLKGLVAVAPNGTVTFTSNLYPGSVSDKEIVRVSGILGMLEPGDFVIADKGFLIADLLPPGVTLNIPPFKTTEQFTPNQVAATLSIAQARIHVERKIRSGKTFQILDFIPGSYVPFASLIFKVCFALTNFKNVLIKEVESTMYEE